jgi:hypothetical protein
VPTKGRNKCSRIAAFEFAHPGNRPGMARGMLPLRPCGGGKARRPRIVEHAAIERGLNIVLKNMTRAALSVALLVSGLASGLPALAQGYPPPPPPGYAPAPPPPPGVVFAPGAPPPVRVEVVPPPPPYAAAWQPGHWRWDGRRYVWFRGRYVRVPHARHEWVAGHWEPRPGGYFWVEGSWR